MKTKNFCEEATNLINSLPACTGDTARLAHFLSEATNKLEAIFNQANAQFKAGDKHATFNKQTISRLEEKE